MPFILFAKRVSLVCAKLIVLAKFVVLCIHTVFYKYEFPKCFLSHDYQLITPDVFYCLCLKRKRQMSSFSSALPCITIFQYLSCFTKIEQWQGLRGPIWSGFLVNVLYCICPLHFAAVIVWAPQHSPVEVWNMTNYFASHTQDCQRKWRSLPLHLNTNVFILWFSYIYCTAQIWKIWNNVFCKDMSVKMRV